MLSHEAAIYWYVEGTIYSVRPTVAYSYTMTGKEIKRKHFSAMDFKLKALPGIRINEMT